MNINERILVTGGFGFIGSELVRQLVLNKRCHVANVDACTYAANPKSVKKCEYFQIYKEHIVDISISTNILMRVFKEFRPTKVIHLAAESHVDNSIKSSDVFIQTNICGTYHLLDISRQYMNELSDEEKKNFRFLYVSTDEVYGSLDETGYFSETSNYCPSSPYSASKACGDMLVMAWNKTFGLPTLITHCSNNYGEWQNREKLIPRSISLLMDDKKIKLYGGGTNIRDWIYVSDHVNALLTVLEHGVVGETYNIGASCEKTNIDIAKEILNAMYKLTGKERFKDFNENVEFVNDRLGHDYRYAIKSDKIRSLGWEPKTSFEDGIMKTVKFFIENGDK